MFFFFFNEKLKIYWVKRLEWNVCQISPFHPHHKNVASVQHDLSPKHYSNNLIAHLLSSMTTTASASHYYLDNLRKTDVFMSLPWLKTFSVSPLPASQVWARLAWHSRPSDFLFEIPPSSSNKKKFIPGPLSFYFLGLLHITRTDTGHFSNFNVWVPPLPPLSLTREFKFILQNPSEQLPLWGFPWLSLKPFHLCESVSFAKPWTP